MRIVAFLSWLRRLHGGQQIPQRLCHLFGLYVGRKQFDVRASIVQRFCAIRETNVSLHFEFSDVIALPWGPMSDYLKGECDLLNSVDLDVVG